MSAMLAETRRDEATAVVEAPHRERKRVVIIGGGFAGLAAAHALRHSDAELVLIDRRNHHIFQPLLYQVGSLPLGDRGADPSARGDAAKRYRTSGGGNRHRHCLPHDRGVLSRRRRPQDRFRLPCDRDGHAPELLRAR